MVARIKTALIGGALLLCGGCATKQVEYPSGICQGYYNVYSNRNAVILYKRPSSKYGCWIAQGGYNCISR